MILKSKPLIAALHRSGLVVAFTGIIGFVQAKMAFPPAYLIVLLLLGGIALGFLGQISWRRHNYPLYRTPTRMEIVNLAIVGFLGGLLFALKEYSWTFGFSTAKIQTYVSHFNMLSICLYGVLGVWICLNLVDVGLLCKKNYVEMVKVPFEA